MPPSDDSSLAQPYRLYRFLTDVDDVLAAGMDGPLPDLRLISLTRTFLQQCPWLTAAVADPHPQRGWEILTLYDEPDYPLTVQVVAWSPGAVSPIHNHGCWGLVAILQGRETNHFWLRSSTAPAEIMPAGTLDLQAGDLLILHPDAIHHIEASGDEPTITFNLYGEANADQRFEFDLHSGTARAF